MTEQRWAENEKTRNFDGIFEEISIQTLDRLEDILFASCNELFAELFDDNWLARNSVGEICNRFNETFEVFDKLESISYVRLWNSMRRRSLINYLTTMMKRKLSLSSPDERRMGGDKIKEEADLFNEFFTAMSTDDVTEADQNKNSFDILRIISNIIATDEEMLSFELMTLIRKHFKTTDKLFFDKIMK